MTKKKQALNNKLIIASVSTIIAFMTFFITKQGIENTILGAFTFNYGDFTFIFPTAALTSVLASLFVYMTLKSFLYGFTKTQLTNGTTLIPKDLQIVCLTVITAYAAFNIDNELMNLSENGVINLPVTHDFVIFIPTVLVTTVVLTWVVFTILMNFLSTVSQEAGRRQSEALQRLASHSTAITSEPKAQKTEEA